jgi:hypothetical protein
MYHEVSDMNIIPLSFFTSLLLRNLLGVTHLLDAHDLIKTTFASKPCLISLIRCVPTHKNV